MLQKILVFLNRWIKKDKISEITEKKPKKYCLEDYVPALKSVNRRALYREIQAGDIVNVVNPCCSPSELSHIPKGHRSRPMIVAGKKDGLVYGYCGTSGEEKRFEYCFHLNCKDYAVNKDGKIDLSKLCKVQSNRLIKIVDYLQYKDIMIINEQIYLSKNFLNLPYIEIETPIHENQIIRIQEKLYYLYAMINKESALLYPLHSERTCDLSFVFRGKNYGITLKENIIKRIDKHCIPVATLTENLKKRIDSTKRFLQKREKKRNSSPMNDDSFRYCRFEVGQCFYIEEEVYVYLFSWKDRDYGIDLHSNEDNPLQIRRLSCLSSFTIGSILETSLLMPLIDELCFYNLDYQWLYNLLPERNFL